MISNDTRDKLNRFTSIIWHNGTQAVLRRHDPERFEYIDLEGYLDSFQFIFGPTIVAKILVRDEYRTALQDLQTDAYDRGAYVTGQPGIGKTNLLVYLLVELLGQHCKVAVHDNDGQVYALFADSTVNFSPLADGTLLESRDRVWTLSHSNARVPRPPSRFYVHTRRTRTIQTTFPKKERWHEWSKQVCASCYVMDIWSEQEITNLAKLLGFDVQRMIGLHKKWGGTPRTLLEYVDMPDQEIENLYRQSARLAVTDCRIMISSVMENKLSEDTMTQFYFCRPLNFAKPRINRELSCAVVPTPTICHFLAEALQKLNDSIRLEFFDDLGFYSETRGVARYIYKAWLHAFLSAGRSMDCNWLHRQAKVTSLRGTATLISAGSDELKDVKKLPYYWVAPPKFPGIDGALIRQDAIFAVQVTIRAKDKPPEEGLEKLRNDLPANLKNLPWHLVFVGNTDWSIETVANKWAGKIFLPTSKRCVTVGWSQVDPVEEGITYRIRCDENSQLEELIEVEDE
ncbi:hypothetical protein L210DRAFT_3644942 [Boletus edulis BED1]|uniref:Uncharacterized protein n=1 Tax=Boletus edulis BED1 TaxID=1328754 RepID=A0AAD4BWS9_BOLED|nr:hypothetical protein L210DRAFT_3644942 [Boletus edulis BED1]